MPASKSRVLPTTWLLSSVLVKLNILYADPECKAPSINGSRYYVYPARLPDEVTDRATFDWFYCNGALSTCVLPTFMQYGLPYRERTVYFGQDLVLPILVFSPADLLREIEFPLPDDGMATLRACFAQTTRWLVITESRYQLLLAYARLQMHQFATINGTTSLKFAVRLMMRSAPSYLIDASYVLFGGANELPRK